MAEWISVKERLPEDCTPVQVCYIGYYNKKINSDMLACRCDGLWCYWDGGSCSYDPCLEEITHWMPLVPVPPHGRLIDADALMLEIKEYIEEYDELDENGYHNLKWCAMKEAEATIANAPTIIPAEEGEK